MKKSPFLVIMKQLSLIYIGLGLTLLTISLFLKDMLDTFGSIYLIVGDGAYSYDLDKFNYKMVDY